MNYLDSAIANGILQVDYRIRRDFAETHGVGSALISSAN